MSIEYNVLNLPSEIKFADNSSIKNVYASDGRKLSTFYLTPITPTLEPVEKTKVQRGVLFGMPELSADQISNHPIYSKLPSGPIDATNHSVISTYLDKPVVLQKLSNQWGTVFRINGTTYKPTK